MFPRLSLSHAGVLGLGLAFAALCSVPLASCDGGAILPPPVPDAGAGGSGAGGSTASVAASATATATATSTGTSMANACGQCADATCGAEEAACDGECLAIQACLETVCFNLSMIGAMVEEGQCQVKCQNDHPDGKDHHLALVNCASTAKCSPPCTFFPQDYDICKSTASKTACQSQSQACKGSNDCQTYKDCVSTCTTQKDCIACDDSPSGFAGRQLLESFELCVAGECTAEAWLP